MLRRLIGSLQGAILARPGRVAVGSALLAALALLMGTGVELRTTRRDLAPPDDPEQARYDRLVQRMQGGSMIIACAEWTGEPPADGAPPPALRAFADDLSLALAGSPMVARVFHRVDVDWFVRHALGLAPPPALLEAAAALQDRGDLLAGLAGAESLPDLIERLAASMAAESGGGRMPDPARRRQAAAGLAGLSRALEGLGRFLDSPDTVPAELGADPAAARLAAQVPDGGYLASSDGTLLFLLITPAGEDDSLPALRGLLADLRRRAAATAAGRPDLAVAFTGEPAVTVDEMDTVRRDTFITAAVAAAGVGLLTLLVFRWKSHALIVLAALGCGLAWSFGAVYFELGYLNLITSAFISTLVGVGVAYSIHPVSEYEMEEAHTRDPIGAVRAAYHRTGTGVAVSAVTTAVAFFSILLMRFPGFAELGLVAGVGVLLCLVSAMVTLPALLALHGRRRHALEQAGGRVSGGRSSLVDRFWVARGARHVGRYPRSVVAAALLLTVASGWAALGIRFDTDLLALLPADAESIRYQRRMVATSDLSPFFAVATAGDLQELRAMADRAAAEPTLARFDSLLQLLPAEPAAAADALAATAAALDRVRLPAGLAPPRPEALATALGHLEQTLAAAADDAFAAGLADLAAPLEDARAAADSCRRAAAAADPRQVEAWSAGQEKLLEAAGRALQTLRLAAATPPPAADDLPDELRRRYLDDQGRLLAYLHPAGSVFEPGFLDDYVAACRRVDPTATGFPVVFRQMARRITGGFRTAVWGGALLVALVLLIDSRSLRDTLLAGLPLAMGITWMLGGMRLLGLSYNFANLVAVPLIIGVGIDNGVHIIHRWRLEPDRGIGTVMSHTSRAILIASLTTMIGFGSLALASHRGMASLGLVLLLGVGACLVSATVVLPNLLLVLGLARR